MLTYYASSIFKNSILLNR